MRVNRYKRVVEALDRAIDRVDRTSRPAVERLYRRVDSVYTHFPVEMAAVRREQMNDLHAALVADQYAFCYSILRHQRTKLCAMLLSLRAHPLLPHHHSALLALP